MHCIIILIIRLNFHSVEITYNYDGSIKEDVCTCGINDLKYPLIITEELISYSVNYFYNIIPRNFLKRHLKKVEYKSLYNFLYSDEVFQLIYDFSYYLYKYNINSFHLLYMSFGWEIPDDDPCNESLYNDISVVFNKICVKCKNKKKKTVVYLPLAILCIKSSVDDTFIKRYPKWFIENSVYGNNTLDTFSMEISNILDPHGLYDKYFIYIIRIPEFESEIKAINKINSHKIVSPKLNHYSVSPLINKSLNDSDSFNINKMKRIGKWNDSLKKDSGEKISMEIEKDVLQNYDTSIYF